LQLVQLAVLLQQLHWHQTVVGAAPGAIVGFGIGYAATVSIGTKLFTSSLMKIDGLIILV